MSEKPTIECAPNGPFLARGLETLIDLRDEKRLETGRVVALCRCGKSARQPFCDGTHAKIGFDDARGSGRVPDRRDDYGGGGITVHDNRGLCAHAGVCTERLPEVFRMGEEPWIDPDGAPPESIVAITRACPSGALSHTLAAEEPRASDPPPRILVAPGGPLVVQGAIELKDVEWGEGASRERYTLCRCGKSANKPFCDGSHHGASPAEPPQA